MCIRREIFMVAEIDGQEHLPNGETLQSVTSKVSIDETLFQLIRNACPTSFDEGLRKVVGVLDLIAQEEGQTVSGPFRIN